MNPFALKAQVWSHLKADTWQFIVNLELIIVIFFIKSFKVF